MRLTPVLLSFVVVAALAGCDGEKTHSVDYYKTHDADRIAKIKQCDANPGELRESPNCVNAKKAAADMMLDPKNSKVPSL
jgi:hypothetical protein